MSTDKIRTASLQPEQWMRIDTFPLRQDPLPQALKMYKHRGFSRVCVPASELLGFGGQA